MIRLSGIQLLAASIVLWALAVWIFGAPHPAATETAATTPTEAIEESGTDAGETDRSDAAPAPLPAAQGDRGSTMPPAPDAEDASSRAGSARIGETASEQASAGTPAPPAAASDGSHIALAPAPEPGGRDAAAGTAPSATGIGPAAGSPLVPQGPGTTSPQGSVGAPGTPSPARTDRRSEPPNSRPPPPIGTIADINTIAEQINTARRAAWERRFDDALAHYRAAARIQPDSHVVWGEMGNVLWAMRRWPEAAYALEGAATLLIRAGELQAASELVSAVRELDPDAAYRVQQLLWATAQRQSG